MMDAYHEPRGDGTLSPSQLETGARAFLAPGPKKNELSYAQSTNSYDGSVRTPPRAVDMRSVSSNYKQDDDTAATHHLDNLLESLNVS